MGLVKLHKPIGPNKEQVEARLNRVEDCCSFGVDYKQFLERYFMLEPEYIWVGEQPVATPYPYDELVENFEFTIKEKMLIKQIKVGEVANCEDGVQIKRVK